MPWVADPPRYSDFQPAAQQPDTPTIDSSQAAKVSSENANDITINPGKYCKSLLTQSISNSYSVQESHTSYRSLEHIAEDTNFLTLD